ncbi:YitT family protein [Oceanobacillus kimchii]|uniref:YitT family protein n=1 Tax=Oceanobacillus kimchii TaxID=746691 RepID=UPI00034717CF|nr:YitT family protein [Oceanobacillus kimchii]MCT1578490.1 YitT family protein [Oceanobacillus kimchii]MCT2136461.1 YitT family protein [Oceanobacillus kimchii]
MKHFLKDFIFIIIGALFYALAVNMLIIPNNFADGGLTGMSILLHYVFGWSTGIVNFILAAIILTVGFTVLPKRNIILTAITATLISLFLFITENNIEPLADPLVSAIFAGFFSGIGAGLIFRTGSSMGGTSVIARMFHHNLGWDLTRTNFVLDAAVVLAGLFFIGTLNTMYTIILLFIGKKATDLVIEGLDPRKAVSVISTHATEITDVVITNLDTSATVFKGYGGYMKQDADMSYIIISKYQLMKLKRLIYSVDEKAFVVIHDVRDVTGGSFAWEKKRGRK